MKIIRRTVIGVPTLGLCASLLPNHQFYGVQPFFETRSVGRVSLGAGNDSVGGERMLYGIRNEPPEGAINARNPSSRH